ncbi:hypothetical protein KAJ27_10440, partial [bacterium]|nr:hypothetical protein [bacterium]
SPLPTVQTFQRPEEEWITGITNTDTGFLVVNFKEEKFQIYDLDGNFTNELPLPETVDSGNPFCADYDGEWIWYTIYDDSSVYKPKIDGSENQEAFTSENTSISGITVDENFVWVVEDSINANIYKYDKLGNFQESFQSSVDDPTGISFDGKNMWIADLANSNIYKTDMTGNIIKTYRYPGGELRGLSHDKNGYLWGIDFQASTIYKFGFNPIAYCLLQQDVQSGDAVELDASSSSNPSGGLLSYQWIQTNGPQIFLENPNTANASFIAPGTDISGTELEFRLIVQNEDGLSSKSTCTIEVSSSVLDLNAKAGIDQIVSGSQNVLLDGSESNGGIIIEWRQIRGDTVTINASDTKSASFIAPNTDYEQMLTFQLIIKDDNGNMASDIVDVYVVPFEISDIGIPLKVLTKIETNLDLFSFDYNKDGLIDIKDAVFILQKATNMR